MDHLDEILFDALAPRQKPDDALNRKIRMRMKGRTMEQRSRRLQTAAAIVTAVVIGSSVTAFAAWRYLSPKEVAQEIEDDRLAIEFEQNNGLAQVETQSCGGYDITLLGIVSGAKISDFSEHTAEDIAEDKTYIAVAIAHSDGTPMPGMRDADYDPYKMFVSPYIRGLNPADYNAYTLAGGFSDFVKDGVEYRILETANVEVFADRGIYVGVSEGMAYNNQAFVYDEECGEISRRADYQGVNALFVLPVDIAKADKEKAAEILAWAEDRRQDGTEQEGDQAGGENADGIAGKSGFTAETEEFMAKLTADNIDSYAEPIESTRQTVMPDDENYVSFRYELPGGAGGNGRIRLDFLFEPGEYGMSGRFGYAADDGELAGLRIDTWTRNEDGTVTFVVYVPRK